MGAKWLIGVGVNLAGSILINLGTNVMKLGHNKRAELDVPEHLRPPIRRFREWQLGVAAFAVGNAANFLSFGYAAQSLLSAIGCVQFVSNVIFAAVVLKEPVTRNVLAATACIVGGCILLVSFGDHSSRVYTARDLLRLYGEPAYATYLALSFVVVVACSALYHLGVKRTTHAPALAAVHGGVHSGVVAGSSGAWAAALPVLYSVFSALIGTQSVLFSKAIAVLLRATFDGDNQFKSWFIYLVIPCFLLAAAFWITRLNKGLQLFPAMVIVPTLQIAWTLFCILGGMLYFQEYSDFSKLGAAMFAIGLAVMFLGVFLLTRSARPAAAAKAPSSAIAAKISAFQQLEDTAGTSPRILAGRGVIAAGTAAAGAAAAAAAAAAGEARSSADLAGREAGSVQRMLTPPPLREGCGEAEEEGAGLLAAGAVDSSGLGAAPGSGTRVLQLKRAMSSFTRRVREDFRLDEGTAARLAIGLGDEAMPAMSVFGPPVIDFGPSAAVVGPAVAVGQRQGVEMAGGGGGGGGAFGGGGASASPRAVEGIDPLANAITIKGAPSGSPSKGPPLSGLVESIERRARQVGSALSATAEQLLQRGSSGGSGGSPFAAAAGSSGWRRGGYTRADEMAESGDGRASRPILRATEESVEEGAAGGLISGGGGPGRGDGWEGGSGWGGSENGAEAT